MIRRPGRALPPLVLAVGIPLAVAAAGGTAADPLVAGIGGVHRTGCWTPLVVPGTRADGPPVRAWVEDADGQLVGSPPVSPVAGGGRACIRPGRPAARLAIEPLPPGSPAAEAGPSSGGTRSLPGTTVPSTTPLMLLHGELPGAAAAARFVAGERTAMQVVRIEDAPVPPALSPRDLDAFDAAVVCGRAVATLAPDTLQAIDGWVRRGGRLVFIAGGSAAAVARGGTVAASWLPGRDPRSVRLRRFGGLEAYARSGGLAARAPGDGVPVPRFARTGGGPTGRVELFEGSPDDLPLIVRRGHGFGTVTWLGLDIDEPWCGSWPGRDRLLANLLGGRGGGEQGLSTPDSVRSGAPDLAGQLRVAVDTFPATADRPPVAGVPFEVIAGLGVLYVLALYPLDWWLVSRSGRPGIAWITLPVLAGTFTLAAWGVGGLWGRDAAADCRLAEVLDIDAASRLVRASSWLAFRSPTNTTMDLEVAANPALAADADAAVSWFADAGRGFGGLDALAAHPSLAAADYAYGDSLATLRGVPVAAAASRLFEGCWTATAADPLASGTLAADDRGLVRGTVAHHLPFSLTDCRLLHGGWLYDIGTLEPGAVFDTESGRGPRSLPADLTRRSSAGDRDLAERWDMTETDVPRILEVAGLHGAAGGVAYTSIGPGRLARLDLSPLLEVDRAVLVGLAPRGVRGTSWTVRPRHGPEAAPLAAGDADAGSLVRIVIPLIAADAENLP